MPNIGPTPSTRDKPYHFDARHTNPGQHNHDCQTLNITWTTQASSSEEVAFANLKTTQLDDTTERVDGKEYRTKRFLHTRKNGIKDIIDQVAMLVESVWGVELLSTCKKLNAEGCEALYGKNLFVFDITEGSDMPAVKKRLSIFTPFYLDISKPGAGIPRDEESAAIHRLFDKTDVHLQSSLIKRDIFLSFSRKIGMKNVSLFTQLKIQGDMWVSGWEREGGAFRLGQKLMMYTAITNRLKCDIETVILHRTCGSMVNSGFWPWPASEYEGLWSPVVEMVVRQLPNLRTLQLGHYRLDMIPRNNNQDE